MNARCWKGGFFRRAAFVAFKQHRAGAGAGGFFFYRRFQKFVPFCAVFFYARVRCVAADAYGRFGAVFCTGRIVIVRICRKFMPQNFAVGNPANGTSPGRSARRRLPAVSVRGDLYVAETNCFTSLFVGKTGVAAGAIPILSVARLGTGGVFCGKCRHSVPVRKPNAQEHGHSHRQSGYYNSHYNNGNCFAARSAGSVFGY